MSSVHIIKREVNPTEAPAKANVHWTNTLTKETFYSVGTDSVNDWRQSAGIQLGDNVSSLVNDSNYATVEMVNNSISSLVDSSPETLDTLNELANALGDDPNFATTIASQIALIQTSLNDKVDSSRVLTDVPLSAVFTDTVYDDSAIQVEVNINSLKVSDINHVSIELPNVDNTSDADKPISTATQTALDTLTTNFGEVYTISELDSGQLDNRYYTESEIDSQQSTQDIALSSEIEARALADNNLSDRIDANNSDISNITIAINQEAIDRSNSDTTLQNQIDGNATNISTNAGSIVTEASVRAIADVSLQENIDLKYDATNPNNYETPAQLDIRDTANRDRSNHTNTQSISTLTEASNLAIPANAGAIYYPRVNAAGNGWEMWRSFEQYDERTDGLINQQNNVFETFYSVTYDIPEPGDYYFEFEYVYSLNNTTLNFNAHIVDPDNISVYPLHIETKDSAGAGLTLPIVQGGVEGPATTNSGTDQFLNASGAFKKNLQPGQRTFFLEFTAVGNVDLEATVYRANFKLVRIP